MSIAPGARTYELLGLINTHDLLTAYARDTGESVPPAVMYRAQESGRAAQCTAWQVLRPGYKTDPHGHWRDRYLKTFLVRGRDERQAVLDAALAWAAERYDLHEYVRDDGEVSAIWRRVSRAQLRTSDDYVPAAVIVWLERALADAEASGPRSRHWWTAQSS